MERYFKECHPDANLPSHIIMDADAVEKFMSDDHNVKEAGILKSDFTKINDLCGRGKNHIVRAYKQHGLSINDKHTPQGMAMKLFLDHKEAFDFAYAWYSFYNVSSSMSFKQMPGEFKLIKNKLDAFEKESLKWFSGLAKGKELEVRHYREGKSTVILIGHGTYIRAVPIWNDDHRIETISIRQALEDILIYDETAKILGIKASLPKDRDHYIRSFSRCIMGDESLADRADLSQVYSLSSIQKGEFDWDGEGDDEVKKVLLLSAEVQLQDTNETVIELSSNDVKESLKSPLFNFDLNAGILISVKLRFYIDIDGKEEKVVVNITPPAVSDLAQKKHNEIIGEYLKKQKVKLV
jgi:hypothetical protein